MHSACPNRFKELLEKYLVNQISTEEKVELLSILETSLHDKDLEKHIEQTWNKAANIPDRLNNKRKKEILAAIFQNFH
ncbi:MAG: hypothetical protein E6Q24_04925 [Chitinophagaceae bacterium]|nr:MAG: hypothetical protein E6Q24_04925 [Chitinophagaceae bacterium]